MQRITTLETLQVLFFCDAMHPGTWALQERLCEQENSASSVDIAQTEEFITLIDYNFHQN